MSKGYKYAGSDDIDEVAWYFENSGFVKHRSGLKKANELGLYDMCGNVYEFCQDWMDNYSSSSQANPTGPSSGSYRVLRSGCFQDLAYNCKVSDRNFTTQDYKNTYIGLRLAL